MSLDTTRGYAYPVGSDPVSQLTVILAALAQAVDSQLGAMASGSDTVPTGGVGVASKDVSFPVGRFTSAPDVVAVRNASSPADAEPLNVTNVTATGFRVWAKRLAGTGGVDFYWIAREGD